MGAGMTDMSGQADAKLDGAGGFAALLFRDVPPDDLAGYDIPALRSLAESARGFLLAREPGSRPAVRLVDATVGDGPEKTREVTVLEAANGDMPFLLDSTLAELVARGLEPRLVAHPVLSVVRGDRAEVSLAAGAGGEARESLIHIHLDPMPAGPDRDELVSGLLAVYADVASVAADAGRMREQFAGLAADYRANPPDVDGDELAEAAAFLDWLADGHFTLLGMRAYRVREGFTETEPLDGSGLGLLADPALEVLKRGRELVAITPEITSFMGRPNLLLVTKASVKSRVHRRAYLDYVGAKVFSANGRLWGELALVGLFTGSAYTTPAADTPYLRRKVRSVLARAGFDPSSFDGRALTEVLEAYPRDELFQIEADTLFPFALELLRLSAHPRIRALVRTDPYDRFVSVIVFVPKERYDTEVRRRIGLFLAETFDGRLSASYPAYPDGPLARTHVIVGRDGTPTPSVDRDAVERGIGAIVRTWGDRLSDALLGSRPGPSARELASRYSGAFGAAYREAFDAAQAQADIGRIEQLSEASPRAVDLYRRDRDPPERVNLKLFSRGASLPLSERVPLLERLGFRVVNERTYRVEPAGSDEGGRVWLHDMALERTTGRPVAVEGVQAGVEAALLAVLRGLADSDGFNALVLEAGLDWRDAALLRAYGRYLRQITVPYGQEYLATALARHPAIAALVVRLFHGRFGPGEGEAARGGDADRAEITEALRTVESLDDDRILRRSTRFSWRARASRQRICASARWRAAASAGPTGRPTSGRRSSASSRRSR